MTGVQTCALPISHQDNPNTQTHQANPNTNTPSHSPTHTHTHKHTDKHTLTHSHTHTLTGADGSVVAGAVLPESPGALGAVGGGDTEACAALPALPAGDGTCVPGGPLINHGLHCRGQRGSRVSGHSGRG